MLTSNMAEETSCRPKVLPVSRHADPITNPKDVKQDY
jgi:hypothetical protein